MTGPLEYFSMAPIATQLVTPELQPDEQATLQRLVAKLAEKQSRNILRSAYYDYKHALRAVSQVVPPGYNRLGIVLGWSAKAVDILARRCNLDAFVWPDGKIEDVGYNEVFEDNHLVAEISGAMTSAFIHGVSYLINNRGDDRNGEPKSIIFVKDAMNAYGEWNGRTRRLDNCLSITGSDINGVPSSFCLYLNNLTIEGKRNSIGIWEIDRSPHPWGVPVEPLIYKPRPGRPYGSSRITRVVMGLQDAALRTIVRMEGHADIYSFPEMWLLGAPESIFKNADGTQRAVWQVMLGRIKAIPDDEDAENPRADVKQFQAASPQAHIDMLKQQAQMFSGETSIPLTSLGVSDMSNPTSADSYIASREDLIAEAEGATDDFAPGVKRCIMRALAIQNGETSIPEAWRTMGPKWRSPIYLSKAAEADAGSKIVSTVPWLADTDVGLELLGLDDQQIKRAMSAKRRQEGSGILATLRNAANQVAVGAAPTAGQAPGGPPPSGAAGPAQPPPPPAPVNNANGG